VNPNSAGRWDQQQVLQGVIAIAKKADALGFDYVTAQDHPVIPKASSTLIAPRWYDAIATLSFVAAFTKRVRLVTSVLVLPYRNPFTVAKSMATLDVLSRGRAVMGAGVGHMKPEFEALGVSYDERGPITDEYIRIIQGLWREPAFTYQGKYYQSRDMVLSPKPLQRPLPIWAGGNERPAVRRAYSLCQGWAPFLMKPGQMKSLTDYGRGVAKESGRDPDIAVIAPIGPVLRNEVAAPKRSAEQIEARVKQIAGDSEYYQRLVRRNLETASALTTPEDIHEQIKTWKAAGATHFNVNFRYRELSHLTEAIDWFAKEVMPKYR
jgi:probable F420-dependent oxidoreductase